MDDMQAQFFLKARQEHINRHTNNGGDEMHPNEKDFKELVGFLQPTPKERCWDWLGNLKKYFKHLIIVIMVPGIAIWGLNTILNWLFPQ